MSSVVGMLGDGAWGTAIALLLADNGHRVKMWCPDPQNAQSIKVSRCNDRYIPGIHIPEAICPTLDLQEVLCNVDIIFEAIPVKYLRSVVQRAKACNVAMKPWVVLSKGIEPDTLMLPSLLINDVLGQSRAKAALVGPSFAKDLINRDITAVVLATNDDTIANQLTSLLANHYFKIQRSSDLIGAQLCSVLKNIVALAVGIVEGAGYSDNTKALVMTCGLQEMRILVQAHGGQEETVYGLAGVGDLVLTAMGKSGRNVEVGRRLGRGQSVETILQETGYVPESFTSVHALPKLLATLDASLPLFKGLPDVVAQQCTIQTWLDSLFSR